MMARWASRAEEIDGSKRERERERGREIAGA
jgi:hypothetical protein